MEDKQTKDSLAFIKTISRPVKDTSEYEYVAMIVDADVLAEDGITVESIRSAGRGAKDSFNTAVRMRKGVHLMTVGQLATRLAVLEEQKLANSAAAFRLAIDCIMKKTASLQQATAPTTPKRAPG